MSAVRSCTIDLKQQHTAMPMLASARPQSHAGPSQSYLKLSLNFCRYGMLLGAVLILGLGLPSRPDTSVMWWARKQARRELADDLADE